tara:strand:+ start:243 stop:1118 length:876 start_codon:yes stop_codon:yes gene_type:complete
MIYIREYKKQYLKAISELKSFQKSWVNWSSILSIKLKNINGQGVLDLGDDLSNIFQTNAPKGRDQGDLSGGGYAWECLVVWYLNLIYWETPIIITRTNKQVVPKCIRDVLTVTISNNQTNTESDILIFNVPDHKLLNQSKVSVKTLDNHLTSRLKNIDIFNLQCKTNWNDNSQIPMLWDMIYNSKSNLSYVGVGRNGVNPNSAKSFKYGFATVPSYKLSKYKTTTLSVLRVKNLTGGNYWGHPSKPDIASSLKELPNRNFSQVFKGGIGAHIDRQISLDPNLIDKFLNLNW